MKVIKAAAVNVALRTLADDERQRVFSWFDHLGNWETDEHIREMAKPTNFPDTYVLNTSDDMRIFFTLNAAKGEIVVMDLARPSRFQAAGVETE